MVVPTTRLIYVNHGSEQQRIVDAVMKQFPSYRDFCEAIGITLTEKCDPQGKAQRLKNGLEGFKPYQWEKLMEQWYAISLENRTLYMRGLI